MPFFKPANARAIACLALTGTLFISCTKENQTANAGGDSQNQTDAAGKSQNQTVAGKSQNQTAAVGYSQPVDLTRFYESAGSTPESNWFANEDWKIVPKGMQTFDGIPFDVSGTILLRSRNMPKARDAVRAIPIQRKCRYVHLLHGLGYGDREQMTIALMEIHYADGQQSDIPIILGVHVRNWWKEKKEKISKVSDPDSSVAWSGQGAYPPPEQASVRLFRTSFLNPRPNELIDHIDFVSRNTGAIPCIVSLSVGDQKPAPRE